MHINLLAIVVTLSAGCVAKSHKRTDAPKPSGDNSYSGPETLGQWQRQNSNITANLNAVSSPYEVGLVAVGDNGTVIISADEGQTWVQKDVGTKENLYKIKYVNNVIYIAGDNTILMSTDNAKTFIAAGSLSGKIRDIQYTSSSTNPATFWAVGIDGLVLKALAGSNLKELNPANLTWQKIDLPGAGNLNGVNFSFDDGLIVGEGGFISETRDGGSSFSRVTNVSTKANLLTIHRSETIGGEGVLIQRKTISGMPVGAYHWAQRESTDLPTIRNLACISDCMAVGSTSSGATILKYSVDKNDTLDNGVTEASGIRNQLNAIIWSQSRYIAVGANGTVLSRKKSP